MSGVEEIPGNLAPGVEALASRILQLGITLHGTPEEPGLGLVGRVKEIEKLATSIKSRLNMWGGVLLGAFVASGLLNGKAAEVIHTILAGLIK